MLPNRLYLRLLLGTEGPVMKPNGRGISFLSYFREAVDSERAVNKAIGDRTGCWKAGVLVEDDAGSVKKALNELARIAKSRR